MNNFKKYNFRKISAYDSKFIKLREKNQEFLKSYFNFNYMNSFYKGSANSGKAHSYENYLIRMAVFIFEKHEIADMTDIIFFNYLFEMRYDKRFKEYNVSENRFPNACINEYFRYWSFAETKKSEKNPEFIFSESASEDLELVDRPVKKTVRTESIKLTDAVGRNQTLSMRVKEESDWKCQMNQNHSTFLSYFSNKPYVEAHHLVPLSYQGNYQYSLDIPSNIVVLCPNCHRKIHLGMEEDRKEMLEFLYQDRNKRLRKSGINIDFNILKIYYGIDLL